MPQRALPDMIRALFLCSRNRLRSPTAEHVFAAWPGVETDSAGLAPDADVPLSADQLDWADLIFVMERAHRNRLMARYKDHLAGKRIIALDIPDRYDYMQEELVRLLEARAGRFLR